MDPHFGYLGPVPGSMAPTYHLPPNHFENAFQAPAQPHVGIHVDPFHHQYGTDIGVQDPSNLSAQVHAKVNTHTNVSQVGTKITKVISPNVTTSMSENVTINPKTTNMSWMATIKAKFIM